MRSIALTSLALLAALLAGLLAFDAPSGTSAQPQVTYFYPEDGDVLAESPLILRLCFAAPVNIRDLQEGGDFAFRVLTPEGRGLGLRIVFQPDGLGVDVHRGPAPEGDETTGDWTFEWRVTDPETLEPSEGTIVYTVDPEEGEEVPEEPPQRCDETTPVPDQTPPDSQGGDEDDGGGNTFVVVVVIVGGLVAAIGAGAGVWALRTRRSRG